MYRNKNFTTDIELLYGVKLLKIPYFRGIFSRNNLPRRGAHKRESAIVNLDDENAGGSHWVAYVKNNRRVDYFDSFGNLRPPRELVQYFGKGVKIYYNYKRYQKWNESNCGQWCLSFLRDKTSSLRR